MHSITRQHREHNCAGAQFVRLQEKVADPAQHIAGHGHHNTPATKALSALSVATMEAENSRKRRLWQAVHETSLP